MTPFRKKSSLKVIRGHPRSQTTKKGLITNLTRNRSIKYQNDALGVSFPQKVVSLSPEVIRGHELREKVKLRTSLKIG